MCVTCGSGENMSKYEWYAQISSTVSFRSIQIGNGKACSVSDSDIGGLVDVASTPLLVDDIVAPLLIEIVAPVSVEIAAPVLASKSLCNVLCQVLTAHTWAVRSSLCSSCGGCASSSSVRWYCWFVKSIFSRSIFIHKIGSSASICVSKISKTLSSSLFLSSLGVRCSDCPTKSAYPCCVRKLSIFVNVSWWQFDIPV
ncbi:hypothetical protein FRACYDRAFT_246712 [Fragilariopsis cylindrus CCMP1102]|uniref:Uncharacterized protein n=1 Tax=Fragilariopsis cylindrus CCMP1102 TaxID=635003 RepID=A0A1E7EXS8_9STRA|nr:hypothetical protein FRACYDRAFT_246712 [Fragilariopsis cylindrus CCMP1102]|eukprot:OEU10840.1 hypothetical protein FRACYDRAFT_246712 [Fragilariopsis cylindrus CCMP1102]